ncbi:uncharacterized protein LOC134527409 [Bacillus rossius redtenbacheri]|uniref:uncharacterized protein LOC134527409 n=1 Tax=Bacillus rossius redtenbacheri TaxID=93214 RepID=UPI002FDD84C3
MEARLATALCALATLQAAVAPRGGSAPHHRQKRILWITDDGRLALPPGTALVITPSLTMPFVRYPPDGFLSNMSISLPFTINFDKLGLTDNMNPYGVLPPYLARSAGRMSGLLLADYVGKVLARRRHSREAPPPPPPGHAGFHGGERALLYAAVEDFLASFNLDGKACLLRAICEVHGAAPRRYGLLGEMLQLFFTASKSPFAALLGDYVQAERAGGDHGDCWRYYKDCPQSLFAARQENKYREDAAPHDDENEADIETNEVLGEADARTSKVTLSPPERHTEFM